MNVRNLERVAEKKFKTYDDAVIAKQAQIAGTKPTPEKVKIFARYDGTYDVVVYRKIGTKLEGKHIEHVIVDDVVEKKVHGQKSKDRKKNHKK